MLRSAWSFSGLLTVLALVVVILVVVVCALLARPAQATPDPARADGPPAVQDVYCDNGWCAIRQDTLRAIITALQKMSGERAQLRELCGWKDR